MLLRQHSILPPESQVSGEQSAMAPTLTPLIYFPSSTPARAEVLTLVKVLSSGHTLWMRLFWRFRILRPGSFSSAEGILVILFPFKVMIFVLLPPFSAVNNNLSDMIFLKRWPWWRRVTYYISFEHLIAELLCHKSKTSPHYDEGRR